MTLSIRKTGAFGSLFTLFLDSFIRFFGITSLTLFSLPLYSPDPALEDDPVREEDPDFDEEEFEEDEELDEDDDEDRLLFLFDLLLFY